MKKKILSLFMVMALACSMVVTSMATDYDYAHVVVYPAEFNGTLEKGDTVTIPVYLEGLQEDEFMAGAYFAYQEVNDYLEITSITLNSYLATGANAVAAVENGYMNYLNGTYTAESSMAADGWLFSFVCTVTEDIPYNTTTGVKLTAVQLSQTSKVYLNSTDGGTTPQTYASVSYPTDENGDIYYGVLTPDEPISPADMYTIVVEASEDKVVLDQKFDVTVSVDSDYSFTYAEYMMNYDRDKFELVEAPDDAELDEDTDTFHHFFLTFDADGAEGGSTIATYTFKALVQDENNVKGYFTLDADTAFAESFSSSTGGDSEPVSISDAAEVIIAYSEDLSGTAYVNYTSPEGTSVRDEYEEDTTYTVEYTGDAVTVDVVTVPAGATVMFYNEATGEYDLKDCPEYIAEGSYEIKYEISMPGYVTQYGSVDLLIKPPAFVWECTEYVAGYSLVLVYSDADAENGSYNYNGTQMYNVNGAGYLYGVDEEKYENVYALVVKGNPDGDLIKYTTSIAPVVAYSYDVNLSGAADARDIVATMGVYTVNAEYMIDSMMEVQLMADVDHSKDVDETDVNLVKLDYWPS